MLFCFGSTHDRILAEGLAELETSVGARVPRSRIRPDERRADDLDQATEIAARIPSIRLGGSVEIRPVITDQS